MLKREELKRSTENLLIKIKEECLKSELSYVEINKALHLADEELYKSVIHNSCKSLKVDRIRRLLLTLFIYIILFLISTYNICGVVVCLLIVEIN